jgi:F-type H+-transporting ATPase subunit b
VNINLTMIGQAIAFAVFVVFCMKFVWPPVIQALRERQTKISNGLQAAESATKDLELAKEKAAAELKEAKHKAQEIIEQANKRANQAIEESKDSARIEGEKMIVAAKAEIEQEAIRVREALRAEVAALAVSGAEKILGTSVDAKAHSQMLDKLAAEL